MSKQNYKDIFVSKENQLMLVINADSDDTIQEMIKDAASENSDFYISIELKDIETIINAEGLTSSLSNVGRGKNAHHQSLKPLITHYKGGSHISTMLISFTIHETYPIVDIEEALDELYKVVTVEEDIIFSILIDNKLKLDEVRVNAIIKERKDISDAKEIVTTVEESVLCTYDTQEIKHVEFNRKEFIKKAKEFFNLSLPLQRDEIFFIVQADMDKYGKVSAFGAYYGICMSPFTFLVNFKEYSEEVFLAEATDEEAMLKYIKKSKKESNNLYLFKVLYKNFKMQSISSFYGGVHDLDFYMFDYSDDDSKGYGEVLKRFGIVEYSPNINSYRRD